MKIVRTECWREHLELTSPYTIAYETIDSVENVFVRIQAEDGCFGLGVAAPAEEVTGESDDGCYQALSSHLDALLRGADLRHMNALLAELETVMAKTPAARAAVDIALHDLWSKHLRLPLVDWLGRVHSSLPTSITIGIKGVEETLEDARNYQALGFHILKIKIGISLEEDVERLVKVREMFGSDMKIRVDANQGYSSDQYARFMTDTAALDLEFIEQPLKAADIAGMQSLPEEIRRVSCADETLLSPKDAVTCLAPPRPFGIYNIKLMKCGGVAPGCQIAEIARLAGIDLMWGCMDESIIGISAALHAAMASPATRYLDLDGSFDLARDLVTGGFELQDGCLAVNDRPGLGVGLKD